MRPPHAWATNAAMGLSFYSHTFAGNPLDRASDRRVDEAWLARQIEEPGSLAVALWNGRPLVENGERGPQIAYLRAYEEGDNTMVAYQETAFP